MPRRNKEGDDVDSTEIEAERTTTVDNALTKWNKQRWLRSFGIYCMGALTSTGVIAQTLWAPEQDMWTGLGVTIGTLLSAIVATKLVQDNVQEIATLRASLARAQHTKSPSE